MARKLELTAQELAALGKEVWRPDFAAQSKSGEAKPRYHPLTVLGAFALGILLTWNVPLMSVLYPPLVVPSLLAAVAAPVAVLIVARPRVPVPVLAVHEKGVVLPKSFQNVPGLERFGGPMAFRLREIASATRVEDGDNLLVVIRTSGGGGGFADRSMKNGAWASDQLRSTLDAFCDALEKVGVKVTRGGPDALFAAKGNARGPGAPAE